MMRSIKKAVIPIAGLGTRFLPLSKVIPKPIFKTPTTNDILAPSIVDVSCIDKVSIHNNVTEYTLEFFNTVTFNR